MSRSGATATELRAGALLLHRPERLAPDELVRRLGALQAQDVRAFPLALRARTEGLTAAAVAESPGIVRTWLMRGTLHLVPEEDVAWMRALLAPRTAAMTRRGLAQLGFSEDAVGRAIGLVRDLLAGGPCTRADVAALLRRHGLPSAGRAPAHVIGRAATEGVLVLGLDDRVLPAPPPGRAPAEPAVELARRHLAARAPARPEDFAAWSGLPLGAARAAWGELDAVEAGHGGWALRGHEPEPVPPGLVRLLPAFDELLLGWKGREHVVTPEHAKAVLPGGGMLRATVTVGGRAAGTWRRDGVELWAPVDRSLLDAELAEIRSWR
jgi:Winged helix DNA-binding domain